MSDKCGILFFDRFDHTDQHGCVKPSGHHGHHVFENGKGEMIAWDYDFNCPNSQTCDCWDEGDECLIWWRLPKDWKLITEEEHTANRRVRKYKIEICLLDDENKKHWIEWSGYKKARHALDAIRDTRRGHPKFKFRIKIKPNS